MKSNRLSIVRSSVLSLIFSIAATLLFSDPHAAGDAGQAAPVWESTGSMREARVVPTSSLLLDGTASMHQRRYHHRAVSLPGVRVPVIGGHDFVDLTSVEAYDLVAAIWTEVQPMITAPTTTRQRFSRWPGVGDWRTT